MTDPREPKFPACERYRARAATVGPAICVKCGHPPEAHESEPAIRFRSPMGSFPNTNLSPEEARKHMEDIEAARESDFNPDELWAMQEKPHVSDDAPDMGPIPGTEGIESDPPEYPERGYCEVCGVANPGETHDLRCKDTRQSPLPDEPGLHLRCNDRIKAAEQRAEIAEKAWAGARAERDAETRRADDNGDDALRYKAALAEWENGREGAWKDAAQKLEAERDKLKIKVEAQDKCLQYALAGFATEDDASLLAIFHNRYRKMWEKLYPPGGASV